MSGSGEIKCLNLKPRARFLSLANASEKRFGKKQTRPFPRPPPPPAPKSSAGPNFAPRCPRPRCVPPGGRGPRAVPRGDTGTGIAGSAPGRFALLGPFFPSPESSSAMNYGSAPGSAPRSRPGAPGGTEAALLRHSPHPRPPAVPSAHGDGKEKGKKL